MKERRISGEFAVSNFKYRSVAIGIGLEDTRSLVLFKNLVVPCLTSALIV